jgi:hypothetical protein
MVYSRFPPPRNPLADKASTGPLGSLTFLSAKIPFRECPLLAQSGHRVLHCTCLLSGAKRTRRFALHMSAFDFKLLRGCYHAELDEHSKLITADPLFRDFSVANAEHCKRRPSDYLAFCYRMAAKSARPVPAPVHYPMR